jgi:chromate transporter
VLGGARYVESVRNNRLIQSFLAGVSAGVIGVIVVVSLELIPAALTGLPTMVIAVVAFLVIFLLKTDVAFVALGAMSTGILFALARALL